MKVRIGVGIGARLSSSLRASGGHAGDSSSVDPAGVPDGTSGGDALTELSRALESRGFDSLWVPEVLTSEVPDPLVALAWVAARCQHLKLGTTMLLPGRNPVRLAKQVAGLDAMTGGRFLVTFVPGLSIGAERQAIGVPPSARGATIEEVLPLLRRLWTGDPVSHRGPAGEFDDVVVSPRPVQEPFDVWLGGNAPVSLRRCGRLGDGWLPALCTPEEALAGKQVIEEAAEEAGREISPEHFGVSIGYARAPLSEAARAALAARARGRNIEGAVPEGLDALRALLERFVRVGFSKFVVRPLAPPDDWDAELEELAGAVLELQT